MKIEKYPMSNDQLAQIDCRREKCIFQKKGQCSNISPAITLNQNGSGNCWSYLESLSND